MDHVERFYRRALKEAQDEFLRELGTLADGVVSKRTFRKYLNAIPDPAYLHDLSAYIRVTKRKDTPGNQIMFTVAHDLCQYGQPLMRPRSCGYVEREKQLKPEA